MTDQLILSSLNLLFSLGASGARLDVNGLAHRLGASPRAVEAAIVHLERRGLVDGETLRLTMRGLAAAAALAAYRSSGSGQVAA